MSDEITVASGDQKPMGGLTLDDISPTDEICIPINSKKGEGTAYFIFDPMDVQTLRRYRDIATGGAGRRKPKPQEAIRFIFDRKFKRTENMALQLNGHGTEKQYFMQTEKAQVVIDRVVNEYLGEAMPDVDDIKE